MAVAPAYISDLVKKDDHDRFLTAVLAPPAVRGGVMALYAFNAEVAKVRESVSETLIGRMKLQWWRDVIAAVYDGGKVPQGNPVVDALAETIRTYGLSRVHFERLLEARERDMSDESPQDVAALESYAEGTSAALTWLVLEVLGVRDDASMRAGRHVGIAWALTGLLRAVLFHARVNRFLLPQDLMAAEQLTGHDLHERRNAAKVAAGHPRGWLSEGPGATPVRRLRSAPCTAAAGGGPADAQRLARALLTAIQARADFQEAVDHGVGLLRYDHLHRMAGGHNLTDLPVGAEAAQGDGIGEVPRRQDEQRRELHRGGRVGGVEIQHRLLHGLDDVVGRLLFAALALAELRRVVRTMHALGEEFAQGIGVGVVIDRLQLGGFRFGAAHAGIQQHQAAEEIRVLEREV
jgi:phytoene synthase